MIVNTFQSVFPHSHLWFSSDADILLIGKNKEIKIDYGIISERMAKFPGIRAELERFSFNHPSSILGCFLLGEEDMQKFTVLSELNTDDLPLLEFSAPKNLYLYSLTREENFQGILRYKTSLLPPLINFEPDEFRKADFYCNLGICYFDRGLTKEALRNFLQAAKIEPQNSQARLYLGRIYLSQGLYLKAAEELNTAINLNHRGAYAYYWRGKTYCKQQMFRGALADFQKALEISPDEDRFKIAKDQAANEQRQYLARHQPKPQESQDADFYYKRGISCFRKGLVKEALREFLLAEMLDPKNSSVHMHLGKLYLSQGLYLRAIEELNTAIKLNPRKAYAYYYRGKAYYEQQLLSNAIEDFQSALKIIPHEPVFKTALASVLIDMEKYGPAAAQIEDVLRRRPLKGKDPLLWDKLRICYYHLKQYRKACGALKMALKSSPDSVEIRHHLADVYFEQGDYHKAIEMYLSAIEQAPDLVEAHLNLGICYHRQGDYSQARRYLRKVLEHDPYNQRALEVLRRLES